MFYTTINGWTKAKMIETINARLKDVQAFDRGRQTCVYGTADGNHCAVGAFIPDSHPAMSYMGTVGLLLDRYPKLVAHMPLNEAGLTKMQCVHDDRDVEDVGGDRRPALVKWINKNVVDSPCAAAGVV